MTPDELRQTFPNLTPAKGPPALFRINGCGLSVYGERDSERKYDTYVKTYCLSILFIPVLAFCAYRVANAPRGGWYFLGREPLSGFARGWNFLVLATVAVLIGLGGYDSWKNSPEHRAAQLLQRAEEQERAGDLPGAVSTCREALLIGSAPAKSRLVRICTGPLPSLPSARAATVLQKVSACPGGIGAYLDKPAIDKLFGRVDSDAEQDPSAALQLLDALRPVAPDAKAASALEEKLLDLAVAGSPFDVGVVVRLCRILEERQELDRCETLLSRVKDHLGDSDGARILGLILAHKGDSEGSFRLLLPYYQSRLGAYHQAEERVTQAYKAAEARALADLNQGRGPAGFEAAYNRADQAGKDKMVDDYLRSRIVQDPDLKASQAELAKTSDVVDVALDLGIVRLNRAQAMSDPDQRKKELEEAEKVFLAVSGAASQTDLYRVYLGKAKYWLGKHDEGRKLFDEYLASKGRGSEALLQIAMVLRELGTYSEARPLAEEAYKNGKDAAEKLNAALARASIESDDDDAITWLERADSADPITLAHLADARGRKALRSGDEAGAAARFREAVDQYKRVPEDAATLNNIAIALGWIYSATGDIASFDQSVDLLLRAERLDPDSSILVANVGSQLLERAILDLAKETLDVKTLRPRVSIRLLQNLYRDKASRDAVIAKLRASADVKGAMERFQRAIVLGPKRSAAYERLRDVYGLLNDAEGLADLRKKLDSVELDQVDYVKGARESFSGAADSRDLAAAKMMVAQAEHTLDAARKKGDAPTTAAACAEVAEGRMYLAQMGAAVDLDGVVALAEEAYRLCPTTRSRRTAMGASLYRACDRVAGRVSSLADLRKATRRVFGAHVLAGFAMRKDDETLREALREDTDMKRAVALILEDAKAEPDGRTSWEWAVLGGFDPKEAEEAAGVIRASRTEALATDLDLRLAPLDGSSVYARSWMLQILGDSAGAAAVLERAEKLGLPLPK